MSMAKFQLIVPLWTAESTPGPEMVKVWAKSRRAASRPEVRSAPDEGRAEMKVRLTRERSVRSRSSKLRAPDPLLMPMRSPESLRIWVAAVLV